MPKLLGLITVSGRESHTDRLSEIYHFVRNWNLPHLFSFPSPEVVRLRAVCDVDISKLRMEFNSEVAKLRSENRKMSSRIEQLASKNEVLRNNCATKNSSSNKHPRTSSTDK